LDINSTPFPPDLDTELRLALNLAMQAQNMNEEKLAHEIERRVPHAKISSALVKAWKSESRHRWRIPAELIPVICEILQNDTLQRLVLSSKLKEALELGEAAPRVIKLLQKSLAPSNLSSDDGPRSRKPGRKAQ